MGNRQSKATEFEEEKDLVFENPNIQIPVLISSELLLKLEQQSKLNTSKPQADKEAAVLPQQPEKVIKEANEELSSTKLHFETEKVTSKAQRLALPNLNGREKAHFAVETVLKCYKQYPDKPLDCWQQVNLLQDAVRKAETEYLTTV